MFKPNPIVTRLVDIFAALDGGVELVHFKTNVEFVKEYADEGNVKALEMYQELRDALAVLERYTKGFNTNYGE
jgi:hypothetical protein